MAKAKRPQYVHPTFRIAWYDLIRDIEDAKAIIEKYDDDTDYTRDDACNLDELRMTAIRLATEIESVLDGLMGERT